MNWHLHLNFKSSDSSESRDRGFNSVDTPATDVGFGEVDMLESYELVDLELESELLLELLLELLELGAGEGLLSLAGEWFWEWLVMVLSCELIIIVSFSWSLMRLGMSRSVEKLWVAFRVGFTVI